MQEVVIFSNSKTLAAFNLNLGTEIIARAYSAAVRRCVFYTYFNKE